MHKTQPSRLTLKIGTPLILSPGHKDSHIVLVFCRTSLIVHPLESNTQVLSAYYPPGFLALAEIKRIWMPLTVSPGVGWLVHDESALGTSMTINEVPELKYARLRHYIVNRYRKEGPFRMSELEKIAWILENE